MSNIKFKEKYTLNARKNESHNVSIKYPDRIPVICEPFSTKEPQIDKNKYLVPYDITIGQFLFVIRNRIKIPATSALFLFVGNNIICTSHYISEVYKSHKDIDGFLYLIYTTENTFG